jgi:hypothetical protein
MPKATVSKTATSRRSNMKGKRATKPLTSGSTHSCHCVRADAIIGAYVAAPMVGLIERHDKEIVGVLSCYDRVIVNGTLPGFSYSDGMTSYLRANGIRIFDYTKFAEPLRDQIRTNAERLAERNGEDRSVLLAIVRGENVITGFRHADLSQQLPRTSTNQLSRCIKRLRVHGIIKRIGHSAVSDLLTNSCGKRWFLFALGLGQ